MTNQNNIIKTTLLRWWYFFIYKPNSKDIYWGKIIPSIVVLIAFGIWFYLNQTKVDRLKEERNKFVRFTIGTTTGSNNNIRGSRTIDYVYYMNKVKYENWNTWSMLDKSVIVQGGRYYVQFAYNNPSNAEMLFKYPVPDSIANAPDSGWLYMPGYFYKK